MVTVNGLRLYRREPFGCGPFGVGKGTGTS